MTRFGAPMSLITTTLLRARLTHTVSTIATRYRSSLPEMSDSGCKCVEKDDVEVQQNMGPLERALRTKVNDAIKPEVLVVRNDSWKHAHHSGMKGAENTVESHFHVTIVSKAFEDAKLKSALARHRHVFKLLDDEVKKIHGFQVVCKTPSEWEKLQNKDDSPKKESSAKNFS